MRTLTLTLDEPEKVLATLNISKIVEIKISDKEFIYLDRLKDGTWRLTYTT